MSLSQLTRHSVLRAVKEFDSLGRNSFLNKYGFKASKTYLLLHEDQFYDSKAICGAAHQYLSGSSKPLKASDFSGGQKTVAAMLEQLGFVVVRTAPRLYVGDSLGKRLRASCDLFEEGGRCVVVLHSAGGTKGSAGERNPDYKRALVSLTERFRKLGVRIEDVLLDTDRTSSLSMESRRLIAERPLVIGVDISEADFVSQITKQMSRKGSKAKTGGNPRRQIRFELSGPGLRSRAIVIDGVIKGSASVRPLFVLTWNPKKWKMSDKFHQDAAAATRRGEVFPAGWSTGNRRSGIEPGDQVVLLRQQSERGLIGFGIATSEVFQGSHFDGSGKEANFVEVDWVEWLLSDERISIEELEEVTQHTDWNNIMASGIRLSAEDADAVRELWGRDKNRGQFAKPGDEAVDGLTEGAKTSVYVNRYERNRRARAECISHHGGPKCVICGIDFRVQYAGVAPDFIHVHHLVPIASVGKEYQLDPKKDLIPVCPNCHAMIHHGVDTPRSPSEVRQLLGSSQFNQS